MKHALQVTGINKNFKDKAVLTDAAISLQTGDILGLLGRNGCGKSTLLKILYGTEKADALHISYNNATIAPKEIIREQLIAYLPQHHFVPLHLKVQDIILMFLEEPEQQDAVFYSFNMHKLAKTRAGKLSYGELRYFEFLLIANLPHPFMLLDEPFSMIEPLYKERITEHLLQLKKQKGILITDHYYQNILEVSTGNLLLKNGNFITVTSADELELNGYLPKQTKPNE